ncbi:hypothetical protein OS493_008696 [Desmophyllum pertusum]|uniref:Uncharacterized protein n=1 Tax=Desmophyllum pertusum TaxID=174260 RepID=A0A9W9ZV72_9CNID|nr:hypothetical protein OS493_020470 [Desmophyllum pertusum]KAJ7386559.1 hypothetical protein OS493_008696 [Desmophyllum pertusum]
MFRVRQNMFLSYANFQCSQKHHCYELRRILDLKKHCCSFIKTERSQQTRNLTLFWISCPHLILENANKAATAHRKALGKWERKQGLDESDETDFSNKDE